MRDFGDIIYRTETKAYVTNNGTYTVPHPDDETVPFEIHKEFDPLYAEVHAYAQEHPDRVTNEAPYEPSVDDIRAVLLDNLDIAQKGISDAIAECEAAGEISSKKAYEQVYKHNDSLYSVVNGAESVDELNSVTILKPSPENIWELASALVNG